MRQNFKFWNGKERKVNVEEAANGKLYISWNQHMRLCKEAEKAGYRGRVGKAYKPYQSETGNVHIYDTPMIVLKSLDFNT